MLRVKLTGAFSEEVIGKVRYVGDKDHSDGLKLLILTLVYADEPDRGGDFKKDGTLCSELLGLAKGNFVGGS